jgi:hypothetical protein
MQSPQFADQCACGKSFSQPSALTNHKRFCQSSKKRISSAITKAKEVWEEKKRKRQRLSVVDLDGNPASATVGESSSPRVIGGRNSLNVTGRNSTDGTTPVSKLEALTFVTT